MPGKNIRVDLSGAEDARITRAARQDADNPPLGEAELADLRPAHEALPQVVRAFRRAKAAGRARKVQLTLRLDPDIIDFFRATGRGWQTRINAALRAHVERERRKAGKP